MSNITPFDISNVVKFVFEETSKRANSSFDGKHWWQSVFKPGLEKFDKYASTWSDTPALTQLHDEIWPILQFLPEEVILVNRNKITVKEVHFLVQLCCLPKNNQMTLCKLCQIALNVAQLGSCINNFKSREWRIYCLVKKLYPQLCKIETFIDTDALEMLGVAMAAYGYSTESLLEEFKENIRKFDSGI